MPPDPLSARSGLPAVLTVTRSDWERLKAEIARLEDEDRMLNVFARVIENRHGTLLGIGATLREAREEWLR